MQLYLALLWELWPPSSVRRDSYLQDPPLVPVLTLRLVDSGYPTLLTHNAVMSLLQQVGIIAIICHGYATMFYRPDGDNFFYSGS